MTIQSSSHEGAPSRVTLGSLPIVATEGSTIPSEAVLNFILHCIWPGDEFAATRTRIAASIPLLGLTFDTLAAAIEQLLAVKSSAAERARLQQHRRETQTARDSYKPEAKFNWKTVYWPNPPHPQGRPLFGELPFAIRTPWITKSTAIGSAGSCFATEIKQHLRTSGYNYVETEPNPNASANWGAQYNAIAFSQMVEWSFGRRERPALVWETNAAGKPQFADAFREGIYYNDINYIEPAIAEHRVQARRAFETSEIFVLTLGLIEIWRLASDDTVLARYPRQMELSLVRREVLSVQQNVEALERALAVLIEHNPAIKMIVTVSPVPLYATFQGDEKHVVVATQNAKSILNVAVHEFAHKHPDRVVYFPAFETVTWCTENPWDDDRRHVSREAVANVMRLFEEMLVVA